MLTPAQLARNVSSGKFASAYYLFGAEDYRIIEAEKYIAGHFLPDAQMQTNYRKLNARRTAVNELIAQLSNLPMLGERQVFAVSEFQFYRPEQIARVLKLIVPTDPARVVVFSSPSARLPKKNSAFFKAVSKVAQAVEFGKLTAKETADTVRLRLKKHDIEIEPKALDLLVELIAGNMGALEAEAAKLTNFKAVGETITVDDVRQVVSGYEMFNIFSLSDLIVAGDTRQALRVLASLTGAGHSPVTLCGLLAGHFVSLYLVKNGKSPLGRRQFLIRRFREQASRFTNERLENIVQAIAEADADLRGRAANQKTVMEALILQLAGGDRRL